MEEIIIGEQQIRSAAHTLRKYKQGRINLERKIVENEQFWKLRHWEQMRPESNIPATGWLWNVIVSKHADMEDGYPEPNILAREESDKQEAKNLSSIIPVVLEQNGFRKTYSECGWYKLKQGSSVFGVFWDGGKLGGLGDISIKKIDLLNLFWEPGISDIQKSKNVFHVELADRAEIEAKYPVCAGKTGTAEEITKYIYDESIDTTDKCAVVDWYYRRNINGVNTLQYCKFTGNTVLYASENDPVMRESGWYAHGKYPFVIDALFKIEGSPCGYGYTDICKDTQINIDRLNYAIIDNAVKGSKIRYFIRSDGGVNEDEYADWNRDFVHTSMSLGDDSIKQIKIEPLDQLYVAVLNNQIEMLKYTTGSTDVLNGSARTGRTAASAIAALQEAGGKTSRDMISATYCAYKEIIIMVIELIRQFYSVARQFRIVGENGFPEYVYYSNENISVQNQGSDYGVELGERCPQFDIDVHVQKASTYTKMAQNDFALQLYNSGVLNPSNSVQAIMLLELMDFKGKDELIEKISRMGELFSGVELADAVKAKKRAAANGEHYMVARAREKARNSVLPAD
ncbi:MAG: hypothetical protein MJ177_10840 [Clostridia bacterium]|nr:hypothetical protein [Clostridia bacterium]